MKFIFKTFNFFLLCWSLYTNTLFAQDYRVQSYNIEQGLPQTQVNALCEDPTGYIWAATLGGLTRFDGLNFSNISEWQGLPQGFIYHAAADIKGNIWLATEIGLVKYNGRKFHSLKLADNLRENNPHYFAADANANLWALTRTGGAIQVKENQIVRYGKAQGFTDSIISRVAQGKNKNIVWFASRSDGLWRLENRQFTKYAYPVSKILTRKILFDDFDNPILLTPNGLYFFSNNQFHFQVFPTSLPAPVDVGQRLPNGDFLLGTSAGLFRLDAKNILSYFADNEELKTAKVKAIEYDEEGNIWIASDGQGLFKACPTNIKLYLGKEQIISPVVMALQHDNQGNLLIGTYNNGVYSFKNGKATPYEKIKAKEILCSLKDEKGQIWLGTERNGLYIINNQNIKNYTIANGLPSNRVFTFGNSGVDGVIWMATEAGLCYYKDNKFYALKDSRFVGTSIFSFLNIGKDSLLLSSEVGLYLIHNQKITHHYDNEILNKKSSFCMTEDKFGRIWLGKRNGLVCWNPQNQKVWHFSTKDGLASDFIYSLYATEDGSIWAGTGIGFHHIRLNEKEKVQIKVYGKNVGVKGLESNQNAVLLENGNLLFGTTYGIYSINPSLQLEHKLPPKLALRAVRLFYDDKEILKYCKDTSNCYTVPSDPILPTNQNHLTFDFIGISHFQPEGVRYQYIIEGLDKNWSPLSDKTSATFSEIPPGKYKFKLMACNADGIWTKQPLEYAFEIKTPFYRSLWFRIFILLALIGFGAMIQALRNRWKSNREKLIQRLRNEEQNKIREKTAEDFHDELGNKLTRISILTDILASKMEAQDFDIQNIIQKIRENTKELYNGTKDILWSLQPESDNLFGTVQRLSDFGIELYSETEIDFHVPVLEESFKAVFLQMDYSRNIQMICKEALNNALRHANPQNVYLAFELLDKTLIINIKDDGVGFSTEQITKGNGLKNIRLRVQRIGANLTIESKKEQGTMLKITLKLA